MKLTRMLQGKTHDQLYEGIVCDKSGWGLHDLHIKLAFLPLADLISRAQLHYEGVNAVMLCSDLPIAVE